MSIRETVRSRRDRWPLEFDLEGIPRDTRERERLLEQKRALESPQIISQEEIPMPPVQNNFAVDYNAGETVIDINNPPKKGYNPRDPKNQYPRMMYHHETGHTVTVHDAKQQAAAAKRGFSTEPSPSHDYSKVRNGIAAVKEVAPPREEEMSAADLAALDEEEEAIASGDTEGETGEADAEQSAEETEAEAPRKRRR